MNNLESAVDLLENNWCTGALQKEDRYCAVGALAHVLGYQWQFNVDEPELSNNDTAYELVKSSPEGKVLAQTIVEESDPAFVKANGMDWELENGYYDDVILTFNDEQQTVEPVLEMFKLAAKKL